MTRKRRHNVLVVCSTSHLSGREQLSGMLDELSNEKEWCLDIIRPDLFVNVRTYASETGEPYDGLIITMPGDDAIMTRVLKSKMPTVLVNITDRRLSSRTDNIAFVWTDNADIARRAADHLLIRDDFASAGFVHGLGMEFYSYERMTAFRRDMKKRGLATSVFPEGSGTVSSPSPAPWWRDDPAKAAIQRLRSWLRDLPKPAAVMAANDIAAALVINACTAEGIHVPSQVTVVGVDHEISMSAACGMGISSVATNMAEMGRSAVRELDYLFRHLGRKRRPHEVLVAARAVISGDSTALSPAVSHLVAEAMGFIAANRTGRISPEDVAARLGCSRRLLELRFAQTEGTTVRKAIEDARMEEARRRLRAGELGRDIAKSMQFTSANQFYRMFKRHFGVRSAVAKKQSSVNGIIRTVKTGQT